MANRRSYTERNNAIIVILGTTIFSVLAGLLVGAEIQRETHFLGK